ncbi:MULTISPECIES: RCP family class A beta-lactamase [unclassified Salipiger]|uniref:RCP family class A beta-lactamase n=1 Tax=unclassified Salipiger TaxID=2640570 RepID=UPI0013B86238|nr:MULTISPECIES: RCP family class A beta-lactamase [unclassified Salipiger]NDV49024.1 RCP family class A beta-lactamase [Salipiger sp. PrR003]NDW31284.1 RCP family class A beta-lactamase [Salipiger sp. PrR007]
MRFTAPILSRVATGLALGLSMATAAFAETPVEALRGTVARIEEQLGARVGLSLLDTGSGRSWAHREDELFLMNSTVKVPVCGAILARSDAGTLSLSDSLPVREADLVPYAPVMETRVGGTMTLDELCLAAVDQSDNVAANILIKHLGGPEAVTQFFRSVGDPTSRLDRREPELNTFAPGDERDTTSPAAMSETLRALLLGDMLSPQARGQLAEWMRHGGVTGALLRAEAEDDWLILDKSGSGRHTRNLVAVIQPEGEAPWIATMFVSDTDAAFEVRNAALKDLGRAVVAVVRE